MSDDTHVVFSKQFYQPFGQIIDVVGSRRTSAIVELWTPWIRYNLENLLDLPTFSPSRVPTEINHLTLNPADDLDPPSKADRFQIVTKAIIYQIILALEYLHGLDLPIGHRDIKPRNVLLTASGCVKLIDFGIAFHERLNSRTTNLWPETTENMYNDVSTGPFRAPELLFGPRTYDACATDLWSLGCTIAHFFTPIRLLRKSYYDEDEDDLNASDEDAFPDASGFVLPKDLGSITFRTAEWMRLPLFDGRQGSIGLVWSIFKLRGTPNSEIWPNFDALPDANKVEFKVVPSVDLLPYMPNLPFGTGSTGSAHAPPTIIIPSPLDLIHRLLVYPPETRIKASDALMHPWFLSAHDVPLILPTDHPQARKDASPGNTWETTWHGKEMEHWLSMEFRRR
ncbi:hypothetical protein EW145_g898 [Phellinidium pouzarii]|uniref:Protein kinase domain-containing protein n=1 Tax=Phellinidium pouzarii TaxID=167371 RepID=A0A4S4LH19_9AGAM|nr:hypothetical protein EW145_g898 [Phellinidium pouzarii]